MGTEIATRPLNHPERRRGPARFLQRGRPESKDPVFAFGCCVCWGPGYGTLPCAALGGYTAVVANPDKSNGYEEVAPAFIAGRGSDSAETGAADVADWSQMLPRGATVLDLGCGTGVPISQVLIERGFHVYGVDASPTMVAAFGARFPDVRIECAAVEESDLFERTFDGVVAWGLFFLLDAEVQRRLFAKVAGVLPSGGRFLFTAPTESGSWADIMTGRTSISLGYDAYRNVLQAEGMVLVGTHRDNAGNHYYFAQKT